MTLSFIGNSLPGVAARSRAQGSWKGEKQVGSIALPRAGCHPNKVVASAGNETPRGVEKVEPRIWLERSIPPSPIKCASVASKGVIAQECAVRVLVERKLGGRVRNRGGDTPPVGIERVQQSLKVKELNDLKGLGESPGRRFGEDGLQYTQERIAESTFSVNYFIGTLRMNRGKIADSPTGATQKQWVWMASCVKTQSLLGKNANGAHRSWTSENSSSNRKGKCFQLTSPFIEPAWNFYCHLEECT